MINSELDKWAAELMGYPKGSSLSLNFHPSQDLNQCFMVVEMMINKGYELRYFYPVGPKFQHSAEFIDGKEVLADSPQDAILLAARATGVK